MALRIDVFYRWHKTSGSELIGPVVFGLAGELIVDIFTRHLVELRGAFCPDHDVHDVKGIGFFVWEFYRNQLHTLLFQVR